MANITSREIFEVSDGAAIRFGYPDYGLLDGLMALVEYFNRQLIGQIGHAFENHEKPVEIASIIRR